MFRRLTTQFCYESQHTSLPRSRSGVNRGRLTVESLEDRLMLEGDPFGDEVDRKLAQRAANVAVGNALSEGAYGMAEGACKVLTEAGESARDAIPGGAVLGASLDVASGQKTATEAAEEGIIDYVCGKIGDLVDWIFDSVEPPRDLPAAPLGAQAQPGGGDDPYVPQPAALWAQHSEDTVRLQSDLIGQLHPVDNRAIEVTPRGQDTEPFDVIIEDEQSSAVQLRFHPETGDCEIVGRPTCGR